MERCDTCGYHSNARDFFRRARGGLLGRSKTVCEGCDPYKPSHAERRIFRSVIVLQCYALLAIAWSSIGWVADALSMFLMAEAALLSSLFRIGVHEAGHALAARAMGARVLRVTIGRGPARRTVRLGNTLIDLRSYVFMGGATHFAWLGGSARRWRSILVVIAGPAANGVLAALAFWAASACGPGWPADFLRPTLAGFGLAQAATAIFNLLPFTSRFDGLPSDGRQLFTLLSARIPKVDVATQALLRGQTCLAEQQFNEAAEAFWDAARLKPDATYAFAMVMHCLARAKGDDAAMAFFQAHRPAFEASMGTVDEIHRATIPYLQVNIAWPALKTDLSLANAYSQAALDALPEVSAMLGTRGAYLVATGEVSAGRELLLQAIRASAEGSDRAEFANVLAQADRASGNTASAEAFQDLGRYARTA
jgi:hypothetical protein